MPVGLLNQMWSDHDLSDRTYFASAVADAQYAEELGFDTLWIGEHHRGASSPLYGRVPLPELLIAHLATETSHIRLGPGVKVLPGQRADRTAEEMAMLDLMTNGRAIFGLGSGTTGAVGVEGLDRAAKTALFEQRLDELTGYLIGDLDQTTDQTQLTPRPAPDLIQRLWIGSRTEHTLKIAARYGMNLLLGQAETLERQRPYVNAFRQAGGRGEVRSVRLIFVGETDREALEEVTEAAEAYHAVISRTAENGIERERPDSLAALLDSVSYIVGSPETVARQVADFRTALDADRVDALMHLPKLPPAAIRRSMALFAHEVAPRLA